MKRVLVVLLALLCLLPCGCSQFRDSPDIKPHLIAASEAEENPVRRIDSVERTKGFTTNSKQEQFN